MRKRLWIGLTALVAAACGGEQPAPQPAASAPPAAARPMTPPSTLAASFGQTKNVVFNIDAVRPGADGVEVLGFAFIDGADASNARVSVVLPTADRQWLFPATATARPDIATKFKNPALTLSGFSAFVPRGALPKGQYRIGLFVERDGKQALQYSDKIATVE